MTIQKTTLIAALALTIAAPLSVSANEGPYEIGGKNVFELNREQQSAAPSSLDLNTGITFKAPGSRFEGTYTSGQPYEINGQNIFDHNRELRANGQTDQNATVSTQKKGWLQRYFRPVQQDES